MLLSHCPPECAFSLKHSSVLRRGGLEGKQTKKKDANFLLRADDCLLSGADAVLPSEAANFMSKQPPLTGHTMHHGLLSHNNLRRIPDNTDKQACGESIGTSVQYYSLNFLDQATLFFVPFSGRHRRAEARKRRSRTSMVFAACRSRRQRHPRSWHSIGREMSHVPQQARSYCC